MSRGFLPRGLSNTCPQVCATRSAVASHGQVSNKPKQVKSCPPPRSTVRPLSNALRAFNTHWSWAPCDSGLNGRHEWT